MDQIFNNSYDYFPKRIFIAFLLQANNLVKAPGLAVVLTTVALMSGGTAFLMWLSEKNQYKRNRNGTSMLIFLNIVANLPQVTRQMINQLRNGRMHLVYASLALLLQLL